MMRSAAARSRLARSAVVAFAAAAAVGATVGPAEAAAPPWPAGGYVPSCDSVLLVGAGLAYTDETKPRIVSVQAPRYLAATRTPRVARLLNVHARDACSGVGLVLAQADTDTTSGMTLTLTKASGGFFDSTWDLRAAVAVSGLGVVHWRVALAADRFSAFSLNLDHTALTASTDRVVGPDTVATKEFPAGTDTYVLRRTYAGAPSVSKTVLARGQQVTFRSRFTVVTPTVDAKLSGVKVRLQRKLPGGSWRNVGGAVTTSSSGLAKVATKPTATASYRFSYAGRFAAPWNAPVTSKAVTVTVR